MEKMQELYEKVSKDEALQAKFAEISNNAEKTGEEATSQKLIAFAKEVGYEVTTEEIKAFFQNMLEKQSGSLSDAELDMVAGGKSVQGTILVILSVATLGISCAITSASVEAKTPGACGSTFQ